MTDAVVSRNRAIRWPKAEGLALVVLISIGYGVEIVFQPRVFDDFSPAAILAEVSSIVMEYLLAGSAMLMAITAVERRARGCGWGYGLQLLGAAGAGAFVGVAVWAVCTRQPISVETFPFLCSEFIRLTTVGTFMAVIHWLRHRRREAQSRERRAELESTALQVETELAQLRLLEAQIEPHFLFNTIANLRRTWHVDPVLGLRMHENALRYLEASLPRMRSPMATLGDELQLTRAFLELSSLRMGPRLRFSIDVPPELDDLPFPRMSLLTLVENSLEHGLTPSAQGGSVAIRAEVDADAVVLRVVDDGVGFGMTDSAGNGIGLLNIRSRLRAQYGQAARLTVDSPERGGVSAAIQVPRRPVGGP